MAADEMVGAIRGNDIARLTRIPGIGKKTAERMVLELRDKLPPAGPAATPTAPPVSAVEEDVLSALVNLGYQRPAAEKALDGGEEERKGGIFRRACSATRWRHCRSSAEISSRHGSGSHAVMARHMRTIGLLGSNLSQRRAAVK